MKKTLKKKTKSPTVTPSTPSGFPADSKFLTFRSALEMTSPFLLRRPTGILSLDIALRGGIPGGTITQLFGQDGVGKDQLFYRMAAQIQQNYGGKAKVFLATFGYTWDTSAMLLAGMSLPYCDAFAAAGISLNHPRYSKFFKRVGDLVSIEFNPESFNPDDDIGPAEYILSGVAQCVATGEYQLGLVNELPAAETHWDYGMEIGEDPRRAALASVMASFQRKYFRALRAVPVNETSLVIINQARSSMATSVYANPLTEPGGFALKHMKAVDIHMKVVGKVKCGETVIGKQVCFLVSKGKCGLSEGGTCTVDFIFNEGFDTVKDLIEVCSSFGLLEKSGAWYALQDGTKLGQGVSAVKEALEKDPGLEKILRSRAYEKAGLNGVHFV